MADEEHQCTFGWLLQDLQHTDVGPAACPTAGKSESHARTPVSAGRAGLRRRDRGPFRRGPGLLRGNTGCERRDHANQEPAVNFSSSELPRHSLSLPPHFVPAMGPLAYGGPQTQGFELRAASFAWIRARPSWPIPLSAAR